jgi:hypothetical protein
MKGEDATGIERARGTALDSLARSHAGLCDRGWLLLDLLDIGAGVGETSLLRIYKAGGGNG